MRVEYVCTVVEELVQQAGNLGMMASEDKVYSRNQVLKQLGIHDFVPDRAEKVPASIPDILEKLADYAVEQKQIENLLEEREQLTSSLMNVFIPQPSVVNHRFYEKYEKDPVEATNYFYELSQNSNYIQTKRIAKNIYYQVESEYGSLDITINLSKPEKDPKEIEKEKQRKMDASYPLCLLCMENEGYGGRIGHPARSNHRLIRVPLEGERWYLQYSPYVYYNEHCILLAEEHRDMKIQASTFKRLLVFVEKYPHYFMGSNADIPIVGGSILSHDHYQGGRYEFTLAKAPADYSFSLTAYPDVQGSIVKWPMTVLRLRSGNQENLVNAADMILKKWKDYNDPARDIQAYTKGTAHNTITPIARCRGDEYELDLVLRNNRTNDEHPEGIFHPHADVHHIKKENIGLIEVMGLAVLPKRLAEELKEVERYLLKDNQKVEPAHLPWAKELKKKYGEQTDEERADAIVKMEVGKKFLRVLEDAGVFKRDVNGQKGLEAFIKTLNEGS
ncbi:UDPglucose--hexose-1-phosphate uridylyltransferase [Salibacterium salarium]|uniref:UDP-glucose--hexose-1-phosphate uridylyltransferase n=1 Tax=Salibacterium salarium TaxID=284579 RepID=UPI00278893AB|nr:UDP-glucose--hexose-1-phosphate uridylyltransferase [Salibacterium salarium]MDQ0298147.1 UDPglucose--hexose-1-phosphate uridylyltransferase [Salibacterium salarium]